MSKRPPPRRRKAGNPKPAQAGSTVDRLIGMIRSAQQELVDLEEDELSARARAERHSRLWGLKAQLALATGANLEAERASAEQARWMAEARQPADAVVCPSCAAADIAARDAARFLREARETFLVAGYPEAAVDALIAGRPLLEQAEAAFRAEGE